MTIDDFDDLLAKIAARRAEEAPRYVVEVSPEGLFRVAYVFNEGAKVSLEGSIVDRAAAECRRESWLDPLRDEPIRKLVLHLEASDVLAALRRAGWSLASHGDRGTDPTINYWLFLHPDGAWARGEDVVDDRALLRALVQVAERYRTFARAEVRSQVATTPPPESDDWVAQTVVDELRSLRGVARAARALADVLDAVDAHPSTDAVHVAATTQGVAYAGPHYGSALDALRASLDAADVALADAADPAALVGAVAPLLDGLDAEQVEGLLSGLGRRAGLDLSWRAEEASASSALPILDDGARVREVFRRALDGYWNVRNGPTSRDPAATLEEAVEAAFAALLSLPVAPESSLAALARVVVYGKELEAKIRTGSRLPPEVGANLLTLSSDVKKVFTYVFEAVTTFTLPPNYGPGRCKTCGWTLARPGTPGCRTDFCAYRPEDPTEVDRVEERREVLLEDELAKILSTPRVARSEAQNGRLREIVRRALPTERQERGIAL